MSDAEPGDDSDAEPGDDSDAEPSDDSDAESTAEAATGGRPGPDPTRRAMLLGTGTALAAIVGVVTFPDDRPSPPDVDYDDAAVARVVDLGVPVRAETLPVPIDAAQIATHRERARSLLAETPADPAIPNEAVAREYRRRYEGVVRDLEEASRATTPFERLESYRWARQEAADVHAVWRAFRDGLTLEAVLDRRTGIRATLDDVAERWRYVGDPAEPTRALVVHEELEGLIRGGRRDLEEAADPRGRFDSEVLAVGEAAANVERARAVAVDAAALYDRFVGSLDDRRSLRGAFEHATELLVADVVDRCPDRLADDWESRSTRELRYTTARPLMETAHRETVWRCRQAPEARDREGLATAALLAAGARRDLAALGAVREAVSGGRYGVPESVAALRREKLAALGAVDRARHATPTPVATRWATAGALEVRHGDDGLTYALDHGDGAVSLDEVTESAAAYAWGRFRAGAAPDALATLSGTLDAAVTRTDP